MMPLTTAIRPNNLFRHLGVQCFARLITLSAVEGVRHPPLDNRTLPRILFLGNIVSQARAPSFDVLARAPQSARGTTT
jgi:hypothetical protein